MFTKGELQVILIALDNYCPPTEEEDNFLDNLKDKVIKELSHG